MVATTVCYEIDEITRKKKKKQKGEASHIQKRKILENQSMMLPIVV